jgi:hypothetical protein
MNIEDLISAANPLPTATAPGTDSARARQTLQRILAEAEPTNSRPGRRRSRLIFGGLAAAAAAAIAVTLIVPDVSGRPRPWLGSRTLSGALGKLALVALSQPPAQPPGPGQYQYTDSRSLSSSQTFDSPKIFYTVTFRLHRQIWIGSNGSGRIKESPSHPHFLTAKDRARWIAAGRPSLGIRPTDERFGPHQLTLGPVNLFKLPTNPARLAALLTARKIESGPPGPAEDFVQIGDLLRETDAPPALRASLFKVAERLPGVRLLGSVTDRAGRRGIGIAYFSYPPKDKYPGQYGKSELIFDPKTSALLGEQTVLVNSRTRTSTVTSWTVYLKTGVVDSVTSTKLVIGRGAAAGPA